MTAQEFVKERYPKAWVQHIETNNVFDKRGYWLCFADFKDRMRLSEGKSKSNAWVNAKKWIQEEEESKKNKTISK